MIIHKVERGRLVENACSPVSQMQKIALQAKPTAPGAAPRYLKADVGHYSPASSDASSPARFDDPDGSPELTFEPLDSARLSRARTREQPAENGVELDDAFCWTIVGISGFTYAYTMPAEQPPRDCRISPIPRVTEASLSADRTLSLSIVQFDTSCMRLYLNGHPLKVDPYVMAKASSSISAAAAAAAAANRLGAADRFTAVLPADAEPGALCVRRDDGVQYHTKWAVQRKAQSTALELLEIGGMFTEIVGVGTANGVQVYDLRRGTKLAQCTGVGIGGRQAFGMSDSWVAGVSEKRAVCHVYMLNRGDASAKLVFPFPEEIACVQVLDGGRCIAAGAKSGRILVWATASGRMLGAWDAHYGAVTALSSSDGVLVSGGEDAAAHVWVLAQALDQLARGDTAVAPIASAAEHTMAIAAVHVTPGVLAGRGRMYTAARDHTCKQWRVRVERDGDRYAGRAELLATLLYEASVRDIAVDAGETRVFAATAAGLFQTNLYAHTRASPDDVGAQAELAALGGTGSAVYSEGHVQFVAAETDVVAVGLSHDGTLAVSASRDGTVRVWDAGSRQCLRTISDKQLAGGVAG
ncbi:Pre-rRNA-processing protein ipi3, partial [Coemansia sp. RSA 2618]